MLERRLSLAHLPTPLVALDRLADHLGMRRGSLWAKLDDATGLAGGGNKVRKLEYLCAEAVERGCDILVTGGGAQSNHARLTAAAARRLGLDCALALAGPPPAQAAGNLVLDRLLGAEIFWCDAYGASAIEARITEVADLLQARGRRPHAIALGGSTPVGALGYVRCADEIAAQMPEVEVVVVAGGSGGTQAGLAAGFRSQARVLGVDVGARPALGPFVEGLAVTTAALAGLPAPSGRARIDASQIGAGYGAHTPECREAIELSARLEGLILDPVYTGKAMAGLIAARRRGDIGVDARVVFVHTGGMPALFTPEHSRWVIGAE